MDLLRHGAMPGLFGGIRAPSTLGSHLRSFTWGNVRQLEAVNRLLLGELARRAPLLPGRDTLAFVDIDAMQKRVYGRRKQGAAFGHTKIQGKSLLVRGLNALAATICTPLGAPVIAATRLRGGNANSARGAARFAAEAIGTARATGCSGLIVVRADSAYYSAAFCGAVRRAGARFSVTVNMDPRSPRRSPPSARTGLDGRSATRARSGMTSSAAGSLTPRSPRAEYTAFTSKKGQAITARLIVRRVRDLNKQAAGQDELFPAWRYHAVFTDSPFELVQAEAQHRDHAVVEQVFADWTDGPLAHLPSGSFPANAAWLACAAIAHNLLRAAGSLASLAYAKARGATIRRDLIDVAARTARHGRGHITLHLPEGWHREHEWMTLFAAACGPPAARPDQPRPGHRTRTARRPPKPSPADQGHRTSRRTGERRGRPRPISRP